MTSSKQIFGIILTLLGVAGLIYTAVQIIDSDSDSFKTLIVIGILGLIFFSAGVKLLRALGDT
jgi:cell division protein FtsW (lipid II flippase)